MEKDINNTTSDNWFQTNIKLQKALITECFNYFGCIIPSATAIPHSTIRCSLSMSQRYIFLQFLNNNPNLDLKTYWTICLPIFTCFQSIWRLLMLTLIHYCRAYPHLFWKVFSIDSGSSQQYWVNFEKFRNNIWNNLGYSHSLNSYENEWDEITQKWIFVYRVKRI